MLPSYAHGGGIATSKSWAEIDKIMLNNCGK